MWVAMSTAARSRRETIRAFTVAVPVATPANSDATSTMPQLG